MKTARAIMKKKGYGSTTKVRSGDNKVYYLDTTLELLLRGMEEDTLIDYFDEVLSTNDLEIIKEEKD